MNLLISLTFVLWMVIARMWSKSILVLTLLLVLLLEQLSRKAAFLLLFSLSLSNTVASYIISILFLLFVIDVKVGLIVLLALLFASLLGDCFRAFFSFSEVLLLLNSVCLSNICILSKVGFLSKFERDVVAFKVMSSLICKSLTCITLF